MKQLLLWFLVAWGESSSALGAFERLYAPTNAAGVEGNSSLLPLGGAGIITERFQQVYSSSLFAMFPEGVGINSFEIRGDGVSGNAFATEVSIEIYLSTTFRSVDGLSRNLDENVGVDARLIRSSDPFTIFGGGGGGGPSEWLTLADVRDNPFYYNPAAGNLLVDIKVYSRSRTSPFDAIYGWDQGSQ